MAKLPIIHNIMVMEVCNNPVLSKLKIGNKYLAPIVKMGWNIYMGNVFLPIYSAIFSGFPLTYSEVFAVKEIKQITAMRTDNAPQSLNSLFEMIRRKGRTGQKLLLYILEKS